MPLATVFLNSLGLLSREDKKWILIFLFSSFSKVFKECFKFPLFLLFDILIISNNKNKGNLKHSLNTFEKELNRKINIHFLSSLDKSPKEFKNTVANGIVLHGYLKIV